MEHLELLKNMCRTCLDNIGTIPLEENDSGEMQFSQMLFVCASVQVLPEEQSPQQLCGGCVCRLRDAFQFRSQCQRSEARLKDLHNLKLEIKPEIVLEDYVNSNDDATFDCAPLDNSSNDATPSSVDKPKKIVKNNLSGLRKKLKNKALRGRDKKKHSKGRKERRKKKLKKELLKKKVKEEMFEGDYFESDMEEDLENKFIDHVPPVEVVLKLENDDNTGQGSSCDKTTQDFDCKEDTMAVELKKDVHKTEEGVTCNICGVYLRKRASLAGHYKIHTGEKPFSCEKCGKSYITKTKLKYHMDTHVPAHLRNFPCPVCHKSLSSKAFLQQHLLNHSNVRPHQCSMCDAAFPTHTQLKRHAKNHVDPDIRKQNKYICDLCGQCYLNKSYLIHHFKIHADERPFKCETCDMRFRTRVRLRQHSETHVSPRVHRFVCDVCGKGVSSRSFLREHKLTHTGEKPYSCSVCQASFRLHRQMLRHMGQHDTQRPRTHMCDICGKLFLSSYDVKYHKKTHSSERPHTCMICGKSFRTRSSYCAHIRLHTHTKDFLCSHCPKAFSTKSSLRKHVLVHTGEKPHTCEQCGKCFALSGNLKVHIKSHANIKAYKAPPNYPCDMCHNVFRYPKNLSRHRKIKHDIPNRCAGRPRKIKQEAPAGNTNINITTAIPTADRGDAAHHVENH